MIREVADGIRWIHQCYETDDWHMHISQYLVEGDGGYVLIDAGSDHRRGQAVGEIGDALGGDDLDAMVLTHSILPHTENVPRIEREWPGVEVISAANAPTVIGLPDAQPKVLNDRREIAGERFSFMDPLLTDVVGSNWALHEPSGTLFTAEGVGHYHRPDDCDRTSSEMADGVPYEAIHSFHRDKLAFLGYVDPAKLRGGFESVLEGFDIERIAPMHGNPVDPGDVDGYVDRVIESAGEFAGDWTPEQGIPGD